MDSLGHTQPGGGNEDALVHPRGGGAGRAPPEVGGRGGGAAGLRPPRASSPPPPQPPPGRVDGWSRRRRVSPAPPPEARGLDAEDHQPRRHPGSSRRARSPRLSVSTWVEAVGPGRRSSWLSPSSSRCQLPGRGPRDGVDEHDRGGVVPEFSRSIGSRSRAVPRARERAQRPARQPAGPPAPSSPRIRFPRPITSTRPSTPPVRRSISSRRKCVEQEMQGS